MNYWILQSNPEYFDILGWLRDFPWLKDEPLTDRWYISFFKDKVMPDDTVFIWKSKGRSDIRGIYAKGRVEPLPVPDKFPLAEKEKDYCVGKEGLAKLEKMRRNRKHLAVKYTKLCLDKPLLSDAIKEVSQLRGLTILKKGGVCSPGIHKVEPGQGRIIESLLCRA